MHPYFSTHVQPWQNFNPIDVSMYQRPIPWFDPAAYQAMYNPTPYNPAIYRGAFPGFETNPYYAGILPRPVFDVPPVSVSPEIAHGLSPVGVSGFSVPEYLSPDNFISGFGDRAGN